MSTSRARDLFAVPINALVGRIDQVLDAGEPAGDVDEPHTLSFRNLNPDHRVVTITGGRGSGKTTLLSLLLESLSDRDDLLVIPPIQPEFFGPNDSIFGAAIARLRRAFDDARALAPNGFAQEEGDGSLLPSDIDRLLRQASLFSGPVDPSITQSTLDQFTSDFARSAIVGEGFMEDWEATVANMLREVARTRQGAVRSIIVPVDDPDLVPRLLPRMLQQIRLLSVSHNVVVVVCVSLEDAQTTLYESSLATHAAAITPSRGRLATSDAEAQLQKTFPPRYRVELQSIASPARLDFVPIGAELPLSALLDRIRTKGTGLPFRSVLDLFQHGSGRTRTASQYAECLPPTPRQLEDLYYGLLNCVELGRSADQVSSTARTLVESALDCGYRANPISEIARAKLAEFIIVEGERTSRVSINFGPLSYYRDAGSASTMEFTVVADVPTQLRFGAVGGVRSRLEASPNSEVPQATTLGLLLAREFSVDRDLFDEQILGGEPIIGGRRSELANIVIAGEEGDSLFFVLPRWRTQYDYFAIDRIWSKILRDAGDATRGFGADDPPDVGLLLSLLFIRVVSDVQHLRRTSFSARSMVEDLSLSSDAASGTLETAFASAHSSLLRAAREADASPRGWIFRGWLQELLPMMLHPLIVPAPWRDRVLAIRREGLELCGAPRDSDLKFQRALSRRLQRSLGEPWVDGMLDLADAPGLRERHEEAKRSRTQRTPSGAYGGDIPSGARGRKLDPDLVRNVLRDMKEDTEARAAKVASEMADRESR